MHIVEYAIRLNLQKNNRWKKYTGSYRRFSLKECGWKYFRNNIIYANNNVQGVYLAHCTSDEVCQEFEKRMPYRATTMKVGEEYLLDQKQVEREI